MKFLLATFSAFVFDLLLNVEPNIHLKEEKMTKFVCSPFLGEKLSSREHSYNFYGSRLILSLKKEG